MSVPVAMTQHGKSTPAARFSGFRGTPGEDVRDGLSLAADTGKASAAAVAQSGETANPLVNRLNKILDITPVSCILIQQPERLRKFA